jgi:hypothetical protein
MIFVRFRVNAKGRVDPLLKLFTLRPKPLQHVRINVDVASLYADYDNDAFSQKTNADPTFLSVACSRIECDEHGRFKYLSCVRKVKSVLADIGRVLLFIPFKMHRDSLRLSARLKPEIVSPADARLNVRS